MTLLPSAITNSIMAQRFWPATWRPPATPKPPPSRLSSPPTSDPPPTTPLAAVGIQKTFILELENGLRLGFFGLLGEAAERVALQTDPIDIADPIEAAVSAVQTLKDNGAEIIIGITHSGVEEDRSLAAEVEGIGIIVGGHSHTALHEPLMVNDTIIVQAGALLRYLGVLELAYNPTTGVFTKERSSRSGRQWSSTPPPRPRLTVPIRRSPNTTLKLRPGLMKSEPFPCCSGRPWPYLPLLL
ncbi:hypothetical protein M1N91_01610 [Dehalococcoidia bacterium]|nr:hypothetical protein [Dehalococcoidia bacterium]